MGLIESLPPLAAGIATWSFLEYAIHRWAGHDPRFRPNLFAKEHVRHHSEGNYFAESYKKVIAGLVVSALVFPVVALCFSVQVSVAYTGGLVGFYLTYEWLHRREHLHRGVGPYGRWARRHHFHHHFVNPKSNHGVTSPLWDFVFRTYEKPATIRVPERLQMMWLVDPQTGDVFDDHRPVYELVRKRTTTRTAA